MSRQRVIKKKEEKASAVTVRTIIGLELLGYAYYMSQSISLRLKLSYTSS